MTRCRQLSAINEQVLKDIQERKSVTVDPAQSPPPVMERPVPNQSAPMNAPQYAEPAPPVNPYTYPNEPTEPKFAQQNNYQQNNQSPGASPSYYSPNPEPTAHKQEYSHQQSYYQSNDYQHQGFAPPALKHQRPQGSSQQGNPHQNRKPFPFGHNAGNSRPKRTSTSTTGSSGIWDNLVNRIKETPPHELINNGCQNAINICSNLQSVASNVNTLLQSFDSMWPVAKNLLSNYGSTLLSKDGTTASTVDSAATRPAQNTYTPPPPPSQQNQPHANPQTPPQQPNYNTETSEEYVPLYRRSQSGIIDTAPVNNQPKTPPQHQHTPPTPPPQNPAGTNQNQPPAGPPRMPSPEDIQQLMNNPLVKNMLSSLMQNNTKQQ